MLGLENKQFLGVEMENFVRLLARCHTHSRLRRDEDVENDKKNLLRAKN